MCLGVNISKKLMHLSLSKLVETLKKILYQLKNLLNVVYLTNTGASILFNNCGTLEKNLKILFCLQTKISMNLYRGTAVHVIYPPLSFNTITPFTVKGDAPISHLERKRKPNTSAYTARFRNENKCT